MVFFQCLLISEYLIEWRLLHQSLHDAIEYWRRCPRVVNVGLTQTFIKDVSTIVFAYRCFSFVGDLVWLSRTTPLSLLFESMGIRDVVGSSWMQRRSTHRGTREISRCISYDPWWCAVGWQILHETTLSSCRDQGVTRNFIQGLWNWSSAIVRGYCN